MYSIKFRPCGVWFTWHLVISLLCAFLLIGTPSIAESYVALGENCTNSYHIDKDCDGYGVAALLGPDADDNDALVNTSHTVVAVYGGLINFLNHLGYNPKRIMYIATDGNDLDAEIDNVDRPYKSFDTVRRLFLPGDAIVYREGNYTEGINSAEVIPLLQGSPDDPIIVMAYPGEKVTIRGGSYGTNLGKASHLILDGFIFADATYGIRGYENNHITYRNIEVKNCNSGILCMQGLNDLLLENCVIHDSHGSHGVYWGARDLPNTNLTMRDCIVFRNSMTGFQHNGRVTNLWLENNTIHSNKMAAISLLQGVSNSIFRKNLLFNNNQSFVFSLYDNAAIPTVQPYDQKNNLIVDNIGWTGAYRWNDGSTETMDYPAVHFDDNTVSHHSMDNNVFRNNIFVTYRGPLFRFDQPKFAETTLIENNTLYREYGPDKAMVYGGTSYSFDDFENFSGSIRDNIFEDPQFMNVSIDYYNTPERFDFNYQIEPVPPPVVPPAIITTTLPGGVQGQAYQTTLAASGGTPPLVWKLYSGSLPTGLNLNTSGTVSGTPTQIGNYTFTVVTTDSSSPAQVATKQFSIQIQSPPVAITTTSLPNGTQSQAYQAALAASGGTPPLTWNVSAGSLPAGLALSTSGVVSGTPSQSGTYTFTVMVTDSSAPAQSAMKQLSIQIQSPPVAITTTSLPNGTQGQLYQAVLAASGGTPPFTWKVSTGSLPAGLSLSTSGVLSGTPTQSGTFTFTVMVTDSSSPVKSASKQLSVQFQSLLPLAITTASLPEASVGQAYQATLEASGGVQPLMWKMYSGSLPPGLTLGESGIISGTPIRKGTYGFRVKVTDSSAPAKTTIKYFRIICRPLTITTASLPNANISKSYQAELKATGGVQPLTWKMYSGSLPPGLILSQSGLISGTPTRTGYYSFRVRVTDSFTPAQTAIKYYRMRVY